METGRNISRGRIGSGLGLRSYSKGLACHGVLSLVLGIQGRQRRTRLSTLRRAAERITGRELDINLYECSYHDERYCVLSSHNAISTSVPSKTRYSCCFGAMHPATHMNCRIIRAAHTFSAAKCSSWTALLGLIYLRSQLCSRKAIEKAVILRTVR
jgi:hypothetical protein